MLLVRMIDEKTVDIIRVRVRNVKLSSCAVWDANLPQSGAISWWYMYKLADINITTLN
jgi:hypothetical protein